ARQQVMGAPRLDVREVIVGKPGIARGAPAQVVELDADIDLVIIVIVIVIVIVAAGTLRGDGALQPREVRSVRVVEELAEALMQRAAATDVTEVEVTRKLAALSTNPPVLVALEPQVNLQARIEILSPVARALLVHE